MWLDKQKDSRAKLTRWSLLLQEFSFTVEHCPYTQNEFADFLSQFPDPAQHRQPVSEERMFVPKPNLLSAAISPADIDQICRQAQPIPKNRRKWERINELGPVSAHEEKFTESYEIDIGFTRE